MKRPSDVNDGENISACIVVLKNQHGYFSWEGQRKRCHGATSVVISNLSSSIEILKAVVSSSGDESQAVRVSSKGTQSTACSGNEFLDALVSDKPGNSMHDDGAKMGSDPKQRRRKGRERSKGPKWIRSADCSGGEFLEALVLDKSGNSVHVDRGKLGADSDEWKIKKK
ncbi:hypothetical protein MA16_Dca015775 [Dendrobium catenatum]|uniref:Uncharacterized protein n=1 Tax=Dendrobium catenatum TaxID=906689 RepID=A0A2I0WS65_9ASPA|nr:hypothetical protein MA16_Dca015775 [Dendrobium catenatum]